MKRITFLIIYLISTAATAQDIAVELSVQNPILCSIEPIFYGLKIINNSAEVREIKIPWNLRRTPIIEFFDKKNNEWKELKNSNRTNYDRFPLVAGGGLTSDNYNKKIFIKPTQSIKQNFVYVPFDNNAYTSKNYYFKSGDTLNIRVAYLIDTESKDVVYSNEHTIVINDSIESEKNVIKYFKSLIIPHFIFEIAIFNPAYGGSPSPSTIKFMGVEQAKYILENYPNSKYAAWADVHLAWNDYLAAEKNQLEAKYNLAQDSTQAVYEAKTLIIQAERHLESALESKNTLVKPYAKQLYYSVVNMKMTLRLYATLEEYLKATEYIDSFLQKN